MLLLGPPPPPPRLLTAESSVEPNLEADDATPLIALLPPKLLLPTLLGELNVLPSLE